MGSAGAHIAIIVSYDPASSSGDFVYTPSSQLIRRILEEGLYIVGKSSGHMKREATPRTCGFETCHQAISFLVAKGQSLAYKFKFGIPTPDEADPRSTYPKFHYGVLLQSGYTGKGIGASIRISIISHWADAVVVPEACRDPDSGKQGRWREGRIPVCIHEMLDIGPTCP